MLGYVSGMPVRALGVLLTTLLVTQILCEEGSEVPVPQHITLKADKGSQTLFVTWESGRTSTFDVQILRTELMEVEFNETLEVRLDPVTGSHHWSWRSAVPLECTSFSVQVRSRHTHGFSDWSPLQTLQGMDLPSNPRAQMYPQDRVALAGSAMTFCCVVPEGQSFQGIVYWTTAMTESRLSRRTYAVAKSDLPPSNTSGTNVYCRTKEGGIVTGAVVFVGYPPQPSDLVCETRDLVSAFCQWNKGRNTHLIGRVRQTYYTLNGRNCSVSSRKMECKWENWEDNWTLVARNGLGEYRLTDSADRTHRVHPPAPTNVSAAEVRAWNASVLWDWEVRGYKEMLLICEVQLSNNGLSSTRKYTGQGLTRVLLDRLHPDEEYAVMVRCGNQNPFWKWGDWSSVQRFQTRMDCPRSPDVWAWMDTNTTGRVVWKPLSRWDSHGLLSGYQVTVNSPSEPSPETFSLSPNTHGAPLNLRNPGAGATVTVTARNLACASPPASISLSGSWEDTEDNVTHIASSSGTFDLSWPPSPDASCGYVVEWFNTSCGQDCGVEWTKVPAGNVSVSIQSSDLIAGVRYTISVYTCSAGAHLLLDRSYGYTQELAPSRRVKNLSATQLGSDVQLQWETIPMEYQRGFLQGYTVYNSTNLQLLANITDPELRKHTLKSLALNTYKFTVKAYTSSGEGEGSTISIKMEAYTDWLIIQILVALAAMTLFFLFITVVCYKKRKWVKKAFYPEIPEPKLPGDWAVGQGTLDMKPSPHSMVHIVENPEWDSSKEGLMLVPEDGEAVDTDSDEPAALRYYNQVVSDAPRVPDSSASSTASADSARTEVTYTGVQTSASSLETPPAPGSQLSSGGGYRPQMVPTESPGDPRAATGSFGGYQPQCSWKLDSPGGGSVENSLGSPTSVTSSHFLLPDASLLEEEGGRPASSTTWFHNLLSGKP